MYVYIYNIYAGYIPTYTHAFVQRSPGWTDMDGQGPCSDWLQHRVGGVLKHGEPPVIIHFDVFSTKKTHPLLGTPMTSVETSI